MIEDYLRRCGLDIKLDQGVDNLTMAISLVASTRGLALMPAYAKNSAAVVRGQPSAGGRSANDRSSGGLQQVEHFADSRTVPLQD